MRTTLRLDDALLRRAKARAADRGTTLTALFTDALRAYLAGLDAPPSARERIELLTVGGDGLQPGVNLDSNADLLDLMDEFDAAH